MTFSNQLAMLVVAGNIEQVRELALGLDLEEDMSKTPTFHGTDLQLAKLRGPSSSTRTGAEQTSQER